MKTSKLQGALLLVAGGLAVFIGAAILLAPAAFHGNAGIEVGRAASLPSEMRAAGGLLL